MVRHVEVLLRRGGKGIILVAAFSASPLTAQSQENQGSRGQSAEYQAVAECAAISAPQDRLACYDRSAAALAAAIRERKVAVVDSSAVREARRGIFGLSLPRLRLFDGDDAEAVTAIDSTITAVRMAKDGMPVFVLEDGARWKQTEGRNVFAQPGQPIHIKRAAMGSYMANVKKQPGVRVVRLAD